MTVKQQIYLSRLAPGSIPSIILQLTTYGGFGTQLHRWQLEGYSPNAFKNHLKVFWFKRIQIQVHVCMCVWRIKRKHDFNKFTFYYWDLYSLLQITLLIHITSLVKKSLRILQWFLHYLCIWIHISNSFHRPVCQMYYILDIKDFEYREDQKEIST